MRSSDAIIIGAGQPIGQLRWVVPIHSTVSELIPTLLLDLQPWDGEPPCA